MTAIYIAHVLVLQVLMECKDALAVQKFITVPSTMGWTDLLQKLKHKYGRAVMFMYEADGHTYTVKDDRDFKQCWDSVEEAFVKSNPVTPSAHLQAFIIDIDPSKFSTSTRTGGMRVGRKSHLAPKRVTLGDDTEAGRDHGVHARRTQQEDFDAKHKAIDDLMRKSGITEAEPSNMRQKWEKLLKECKSMDTRHEKTISSDNFKKALAKVDPKMTPAQVLWFAKDAEKDSQGHVLYEKYCTMKRTGMSVKEGESAQNEEAIKRKESEICAGFKKRYKTSSAAFKRLDEDKDGIINKKDFHNGIENRLKIKIAPKMLEEIFRKADLKSDGLLDYEEFLEYFKTVPDVVDGDSVANLDLLENQALVQHIVQTFGGIGELFSEMDADGNGQLSREEFINGLRNAGINLSPARVESLMKDFSNDNHNVDYRKFLVVASKLSLNDLHDAGKDDDVGREEARARDKIREHFPDAKQAFHAFNKNKDGRLSQEEFFAGIDSVFKSSDRLPLAIKNRLMRRADVDGDGFLAYHEFLARYGVRPQMRQAIQVEKQISTALQIHFPDSLQKAFDQMDQNKDRKLDNEDLRRGITEVLKLKFTDDEIGSFLAKLQVENDSQMDFEQFLVRFGLDFKSAGRWEYKSEKKTVDTNKDPEEVKLFRRSMKAAKWFGRGGIKAVLLRFTILGAMRGKTKESKWLKLRDKCARAHQTSGNATDTITVSQFQDCMKGSSGVDPNITDIQWRQFVEKYIEDEPGKPPKSFRKDGNDQFLLFVKLCEHLDKEECTLAQLGLKEFGSALRDGLGMSGLSSEDVLLLAGKAAKKLWWNFDHSTVDIDAFSTSFLTVLFKSDLILFKVLLVDNVWPDIKRVFDSLNTAPASSRTMITRKDFESGFSRLTALKILEHDQQKAILEKVQRDDLYEKEGTFIGQIDYMKNFLLHYIREEVILHQLVYPHWEDCAEKFQRFAIGENAELNYRQFRELCRQFAFARDLTPGQLETLIDIMDVDGDGNVSLDEFKNRYARDEAKIMKAVRENWNSIQELLKSAGKAGNALNARGRLDRPEFQATLLKAQNEGHMPDVSPGQIMALVVALEPQFIDQKEVKWDLWLQKYAGDYFVIYTAFQQAHLTYKLTKWEVLVSCFEILESSRSIQNDRAWKFVKHKGLRCKICNSTVCLWHREFEHKNMVTWDEFRRVLERAGINIEPAVLNKLLDDLDPPMHGFVHWRYFVEGRIPKQNTIKEFGLQWEKMDGSEKPTVGTEIKNPSLEKALKQKKHKFTDEEWHLFKVPNVSSTSYIRVADKTYFKSVAVEARTWELGEPAAGPYFLNGKKHYILRKVLVEIWNVLLIECVKRQKEEVKKEREKAMTLQKEHTPTKDGMLSEKIFKECLDKCLNQVLLPQASFKEFLETQDDPIPAFSPAKDHQQMINEMIKAAHQSGTVAFSTDKKFVDYYSFCRNYSQGDFNAERYIERKWECVYAQLKESQEKKGLGAGKRAANGLASKKLVKKALESPEMGLSKTMVKMLLESHKADADDDYSDDEGEADDIEGEDEDAQPVDYMALNWRFARKNIQKIMFAKCLTIFRKARTLDKARNKKISSKEMQKVLSDPDVGLSKFEAELFIQMHPAATGLSWKASADKLPPVGIEIMNGALASALREKDKKEKDDEGMVTFELNEWDSFKVSDLSYLSYVKVADKRYFAPAERPLHSCLSTVDSLGREALREGTLEAFSGDAVQGQGINYDALLSGRWEDIPCNPKVSSAQNL